MNFTPHPFQQLGIDFLLDFFISAKRGDATVLAGPTGCGKSVVELLVQEKLNIPIVTPRLEIARGMLEKRGIIPQSFTQLVDAAQEQNIWTPVRFRNRLFRGDFAKVSGIIIDEGHHQSAESYQQLRLAAGLPPIALLTATPFRGTASGTKKFLEDYGEPTWMITLREAVEQGYVAMPTTEVIPLVDDDLIEISSAGDFEITSLENHTMDRLQDLARLAVERWYKDGKWDRTTVFCLPSVKTAQRFAEVLQASSAIIHAKTPDAARRVAFEALKLRYCALIQVSVVGEGVDLPIRRLVDASPCLSPVKWMQLFGRATRPTPSGEARPEYVVTNRNLLRHAYLLDGLVPLRSVSDCATAFPATSERSHRALGLESLGRFKAVHVKLLDGLTAQLYLLSDVSNGRVNEYACFCHPALFEAIWGKRTHGVKPDGSRDYAKWVRCAAPSELRGFVSQSASAPSEKQEKWWSQSAAQYGLDPDVKLTRKNFAALPFLYNLGLRFKKA